MRILAPIHSCNDAEVNEQALDGVARLTRPAEAVLVVDNASTAEVWDKHIPDQVAAWRVVSLILIFTLTLRTYGRQLVACVHDIGHGATGTMATRY